MFQFEHLADGRRSAAGIPVIGGACISAQWRGHVEAVTVSAGEVGGGTAVPVLLRGFAATTREQASNEQYSLSALCERNLCTYIHMYVSLVFLLNKNTLSPPNNSNGGSAYGEALSFRVEVATGSIGGGNWTVPPSPRVLQREHILYMYVQREHIIYMSWTVPPSPRVSL